MPEERRDLEGCSERCSRLSISFRFVVGHSTGELPSGCIALRFFWWWVNNSPHGAAPTILVQLQTEWDLLCGSFGGWTRHAGHQASRIHAQYGGEGEDVEQADVAFTAFDGAHVRPVQAGPVSQLFLGQSRG